MKRYILAILIIGSMNTIFADQDFRKKFLNWRKKLTPAQEKSLKDFIADYDKVYSEKDKTLLPHFEAVFQNIMDKWDSLYKPLTDAKNFRDSVSDFIAANPTNKTVKNYLNAYVKFDDMPTDLDRYMKLLKTESKLKEIIKKT